MKRVDRLFERAKDRSHTRLSEEKWYLGALIYLGIVMLLGMVSVYGQGHQLVSVNKTDTDSGNNGSGSAVMTPDGRYVAFASDANNLGPNDTNGRQDVYVRDLQLGTTTLVSVNKAGTNSGNSGSGDPVITPDGRYVAFSSLASDLVANDFNRRPDIFVRDLMTGVTTLVSVNITGTSSGNLDSNYPVITPDGRYVTFVSYASNLGPNDTNGRQDVYVRDLQLGTTTLVSVNKVGTNSGNGGSIIRRGGRQMDDAITSDGRYIAFQSEASDLVTNDTNGKEDVFVRDLTTGVTMLVSVNKAGTDSGNDWSESPHITLNGRYVTFRSNASDLVANDTNGTYDGFVHDLMTGVTTLVSVNMTGTDGGNSYSYAPVITLDGRYAVFYSEASDLVANDTNGKGDGFIRDMMTGVTVLVGINKAGTNSGNGRSSGPVITLDGRYAAFMSEASDLVANDTNGKEDVFVRDLMTGITMLVSANKVGTDSGNGWSYNPLITSNGRYVAFISYASDLGPNDTNGTSDIYIQPPFCSFSVNPTLTRIGSDGGLGEIEVDSGGRGCDDLSWTAHSTVSWIRITSGASGSGRGKVSYTVDPNSTLSYRTGVIKIGTKNVVVRQSP